MKILIFSRQDHKIIRKIEQAITAFSSISLEQVSDRKKFKQALNSCFAGETLVVFFVDGKKDMAFLESVEMHFMDIKLLIYFIEKDTDMFSRAYKLDPRVVTGAFDCDEFLPAAVQGILLNLIEARTKIDG